ncbi:DUF2252 family protein [Alteromonas lipotrueiana]|uniref:DUF2252 family protein n=1 Tax=Alteromonas lipotrueiana TaxID=2803815 RepID=UPI001FE75948|nr:DUF2252 family protein [Alteromonas lipotrueiana]
MNSLDKTSSIQDREAFVAKQLCRVDGCGPNPLLGKHAKMAESPYAFYRGSAQLFYADLQSNRFHLPDCLTALPLTCVVGDCHVSNFGFITEEGSHGDTVIFAPNDFDDACVGLAGWDIMRFLTSLALAGRYAQGIKAGRFMHDKTRTHKPVVNDEDITEAMAGFIQQYVTTSKQLCDDPDKINTAIENIGPGTRLTKQYDKACRRAAGGREFTTKSALAKAVYMSEDGLRFLCKTEKFTPLAPHYYKELEAAFAPYMDDKIIDIVQRNNAGTGSVNMARYYFLVGPDKPHTADSFSQCHIVEVKQQREAAPLYYFEPLSAVNRLNPAHLTARCQRKMQRKPDLLLDEVCWQQQHYLIRSRHHARVRIDPVDVTMGNKSVNGGFVDYARWCGQALALAHARGDRRSIRFEQAVCNQVTGNEDTLISAAWEYCQQVTTDYQTFVRALSNPETLQD